MTHVEHVQRHYAEAEILGFGKRSAQLIAEAANLEDQKKQATDHFKAQITAVDTEVSELSQRINIGYEIIPTPCDVVLNQPTPGMKQYISIKTLDVIKTVPMDDADKQGGLFGAE